ncbi:MAG: tol-pal system-associated acyl-CoA thioesterase [Pseudomonadota bacterium]
MTAAGPHRLGIRVYYEDTDLAGIVYHANYLKFIERGRSDALRTRGVDQRAMAADGVVFVVRRIAADFLGPARFDDLLTVETVAKAIKGASVVLQQTVLREGAVLFTAEVTIACIDEGGRPIRLAPAIRECLAQLSP